eukprot:TRINITY_DN3201_c0_g1_i3.p1 TRINITY_DN3201_c0_g1~~TRINITY_DN3201_c0_g1_i3.p1  ORF type:complete len:215 (+),score=40.87 TRINITY_DN3201_c0_g1_i3:98-742(+)
MVTLKPLSQQVVVIIGASSGIGRATALRLGKAGAKVVVASRSKPGLDSLVETIKTDGGDALAIQCDVSVRSQVENVASLTMKKYGRIDTWVNVAGVAVWSPVEKIKEEDMRRMYDINVFGVANSIWTAVPILKKNGGSLIVVSSLASCVPIPLLGVYGSTKRAVEGLLTALRIELRNEGAPINLTSIRPGTIKTPLFDNNKVEGGLGPERCDKE